MIVQTPRPASIRSEVFDANANRVTSVTATRVRAAPRASPTAKAFASTLTNAHRVRTHATRTRRAATPRAATTAPATKAWRETASHAMGPTSAHRERTIVMPMQRARTHSKDTNVNATRASQGMANNVTTLMNALSASIAARTLRAPTRWAATTANATKATTAAQHAVISTSVPMVVPSVSPMRTA